MELLHHYRKKLIQKKIFKKAKSYLDIENEIFNLNDNLESGHAFEIFSEAYLKLGIHLPYKDVFPENKIPSKIINGLKLSKSTVNQKGIDGVIVTNTNEIHTYQVKFRKKNHTLSWTELKGAVAISTKASSVMIFTNCDAIPSEISDHGAYAITRYDLNKTSAHDIKRIINFIYKSKIIKNKPNKLYPYQKQAFNDVINAFKKEDRTQLIMACGTGKTLVGQRILEKLNGKISLIFVPSLQLLEQTIDDYFKQTKWNDFPAIFVGSDSSIPRGYDGIKLQPSDLKYEITTDPKKVRKFINKQFKRYVIFSTYQSAHIVGTALKRKIIDFALFDEAHKTASRKDTNFAFALSDKNIKVRKRLFMTATPRKYEIKNVKKINDIKEIYSMSDKSTYGKIAHTLTFYRAAELGVICNYKLIISIITSDDINRKLLKSGDTIIDGETINSEYVAKNLAINDAIKKNKAKKIISFHSTINQAEHFTSDSSHLSINKFNKNYNLFHVNGKMNSKARKSILDEFRDKDNSIISNASCLTEGVDIPAVDMVAFMSPKRSKVDIVQAVGRALRKPKNSTKEFGYIVIPIFLEQSKLESIDDAADSTNFKTIKHVLSALMENDDVLEQIIKSLRIEKGIKGKFNTNPLDKYIDVIGEKITLNNLKSMITSHCIDTMSSKKLENWGMIYRQLKKLREDIESGKKTFEYGGQNNFNFPKVLLNNLNGQYIEANTWATSQRQRYQRDKFKGEEYKIPLLEEIPNWTWNLDESTFDYWYDLLLKFLDEHGHVKVPQSYITKNGETLGLAMNKLRQKKDRLTKEQIKRIDKLKSKGWSWNPKQDEYQLIKEHLLEFLDKLKLFVKKHKHARVNPGDKIGKYVFDKTIDNLRTSRGYQSLSKSFKIKLLNELKSLPYWSDDLALDDWKIRYGFLERYVELNKTTLVHSTFIAKGKKFKDCFPPFNINKKGAKKNEFRLGAWVSGQRKLINQTMTKKDKIKNQKIKIEMLEKFDDWSWDPLWDKYLEGLPYFEKWVKLNHTNWVPIIYDGFKLRVWSLSRIGDVSREFLNDEQLSYLKKSPASEYIFKHKETEAEVNFRIFHEALKIFVKKNKHSRISEGDYISGVEILADYHNHKPVDMRTKYARYLSYYNQNKLPEDIIEKLEEFPFWTWNVRKDDWDISFGYLDRYFKKYDNYNVPYAYIVEGKEFKDYAPPFKPFNQMKAFKLGRWLYTQKKTIKRKPRTEMDKINQKYFIKKLKQLKII